MEDEDGTQHRLLIIKCSVFQTSLKALREVMAPFHRQKFPTGAQHNGEQDGSPARHAIPQIAQEQKGVEFQSYSFESQFI